MPPQLCTMQKPRYVTYIIYVIYVSGIVLGQIKVTVHFKLIFSMHKEQVKILKNTGPNKCKLQEDHAENEKAQYSDSSC